MLRSVNFKKRFSSISYQDQVRDHKFFRSKNTSVLLFRALKYKSTFIDNHLYEHSNQKSSHFINIAFHN